MRHDLPYLPDLGSHLRRYFRPADRSVWLRLDSGRQEVFCAYPVDTLLLSNQAINKESRGESLTKSYTEATWQTARELLAKLPLTPALPDLPFRGGLAGFLGYGPSPDSTGTSFPVAFLGLFPHFIHVDHTRRTAEFICLPGFKEEAAHWKPVFDFVAGITKSAIPSSGFHLTEAFKPLTPPTRYREDFHRIQHYLRNGDCYQVNYAQAFRARCAGSSATAMDRLLAETNPAHAAWVSLPEGDILSLSPELFLRVEDGRVTTRPIKGTAPRSSAPLEDQRLRNQLASSAKNRAENLMIVDLLRHDIGQHAETGTVQVEKLFEVESLPQVHHLVSTVTCILKKESHAIDLIRDSFPGGSITGAPKKRAMEIIAELEPTRRSIYCGSIGFINADGDAQLNIAIRSLLRLGDDIYAWAGGGIVADSECESEYEECFHKMGALMSALESMEG
jgi:para-aminobenzoate synthetase component 1